MKVHKKGQKSFTNVYTYIIIFLVFGLFVGGIKILGEELILSDKTDLSTDSQGYIATLHGIDTSNLNKDDNLNEGLDGENVGSSKDEGLDFLFGKQQSSRFDIIYDIYSVPSTILLVVLKLPNESFGWIFTLINMFFWFSITIALILFIRGIMR